MTKKTESVLCVDLKRLIGRFGYGSRYATKSYWWNKLHNIVLRCTSRACPRFYDYGGRGISVCAEWYDADSHRYNLGAFVSWCLDNGWSEELQIDRIDNDGDYSPTNCRFVTAYENTRNRRNTRNVTVCGVTHCLKDWCSISGVRYACALNRCKNGAIPTLSFIVSGDARFYVGTDFYAGER